MHLVPIANRFFGGNIAVTGLLTGADVGRALDDLPESARYCCPMSRCRAGHFLDGTTVAELPRPVEIVATDGASLVDACAR